MSPDRLKKDPITRTVEDLDRSRKWVVFLTVLVTVLVVAVVLLGFALRDLSDYVKDPAGRTNRLEYQCAVERKIHIAEVDCRG